MTMLTAAQLRQASRLLSAADHAGTVRSYFPYWDSQMRPFLLRAVEALPADRFDYKPHPTMLTAHQLVIHIAEAERGGVHWMLEGGTYEEWIVPNVDPARGWTTVIDVPDHAATFALLAEWHQRTQRWLDLPAAEAARVVHHRGTDGSDRSATVHWTLDRLQQHEIHHRAQLVTYLRLMGVEPPESM